jgi:preprotein translocase subunit SecA
VLVITKYIREAEKIEKTLCGDQFGHDHSKVRLFRTNKDASVIRERLGAGQIIIATNIAGRGTDIIPTFEVELHGGMHVCVTFVPMNERVQRQNTGRTSRTGNRGTSQFIVFEPLCNEYAMLELMRDEQERVSIEMAKKEIANVTSKDAVFKDFCLLLDKIKVRYNTYF